MIESRPDLRKKCVKFGSHRRAVSQSGLSPAHHRNSTGHVWMNVRGRT